MWCEERCEGENKWVLKLFGDVETVDSSRLVKWGVWKLMCWESTNWKTKNMGWVNKSMSDGKESDCSRSEKNGE